MLRLLSGLFLASIASAAQCGGDAFALPIQDVLVEPNVTDSYEKGIPISIGTPQQNLVVLPWAELNNTYLYDQNSYCDSTVIFDDAICLVRRGGLYLEADSTSFNQSSDVTAAGGATQETSNEGAEAGIKNLVGTSLGGTDTINFANTGALERFPIGIPRQAWDGGYSTLHPLGLGKNSTYLNALYNAGTIASRVWSIYWGRMWTDSNPLNGSLVLGGYDQRKVQGQNFTEKLDYSNSCFTGMKVTITDLVLNFKGGRDESLFNANTAVTACIVPTRQLLFQGPSDIQGAFQDWTETNSTGLSFGIHWGAMLFDAGAVYDGDITFKLDSGLSVRVPNDQFVTPFVAYDRSGARFFNESQREVLIGGLGNQVATLGRYFLTASYIMVDHDKETWTIWNANPTSSSSLKTIDNRGNGNTTCADSDNGSDSKDSSASKGVSGGVVAGIVVGVVALVGLIAAALFGLWRRKRQHAANGPNSQALLGAQPHGSPNNLSTNSMGPQELHGVVAAGKHAPGPPDLSEQTYDNQHYYAPIELQSTSVAQPHAQPPQYHDNNNSNPSAPTIYEMPEGNASANTPLMSANH